MIKDLSCKDLMLVSMYIGLVNPYCFTFTKTVIKSIDRYWHKLNKVRRKNRWVPWTHDVELFDGSTIKVKIGKIYRGKLL